MPKAVFLLQCYENFVAEVDDSTTYYLDTNKKTNYLLKYLLSYYIGFIFVVIFLSLIEK